ncbi:hypothetical protein ACFOFO_17250 [Undibacterium arcticum]|jgi:hypothetical protein|uniref:Formate dehydrogenase n=1 Tax=Undibacterium arcticum TaxID=1762892 RepID=A0ABV7F6Y8_9BURK
MEEVRKTTRRSFFGGLGLLAAAGAALKLSPALVASDATSPQTEPEGKSYRLTEHIKKYYRTTTI